MCYCKLMRVVVVIDNDVTVTGDITGCAKSSICMKFCTAKCVLIQNIHFSSAQSVIKYLCLQKVWKHSHVGVGAKVFPHFMQALVPHILRYICYILVT